MKKKKRISFVTLNAVGLFRSLTWDLTSCSFPGKPLEVLNYTKSVSVLEYYYIVWMFIRVGFVLFCFFLFGYIFCMPYKILLDFFLNIFAHSEY